jgi:glycogen(starch) synthase
MDGIEVHRFPFLEALDPRGRDPLANFERLTGIISAVSEIKRKIKPDIIHINLSDPSPFFHLRSEKVWNCPVVLSFQAAVDPPFLNRNGVLQSLIKSACAMIAPSQAAARNIAHHTGGAEERIHAIAPGVPVEDFVERKTIDTGDHPSFVILGRVVDYKGVDTAIDAIERLNGKARLVVIGDGPHLKHFQHSVEERRLSNLVKFEGLVTDSKRRELLGNSRGMLVPSRHEELFGMVAAEGALSGLPVIASRVGGLADIVVNGETGFVVSPGSVAELASAMEKLVDNPTLASQMGRAGRMRALGKYTIEQTLERYLSIYEECKN